MEQNPFEGYDIRKLTRRCFAMLRLTAIQVEAICPYQIIIVFDNGEKKF